MSLGDRIMGQVANHLPLFLYMATFVYRFFFAALTLALLTVTAAAQPQTKKTEPPALGSSAEEGLRLVGQGRCRDALPILRKSAPVTADKPLKLKAGLATVRCGLMLNQTDAAVSALLWLNREFPKDPDVLYVTTHAYSDLSTRAALELANTAPLSTQARELNAESLESQGKWDEAASEYNAILQQQPSMPGIHYRIGRIILSKPSTATTGDDARKEFEAELAIDPRNAGAEYILGELSRQTEQWDDAIAHFTRASKLDVNFPDAFLGLGFSLNSTGRFAEAVPALEAVVKLQPGNPTGHYQLAIAYGRTGHKEQADREMNLFREASQQALKRSHGEEQPQAQPQ